MGAGVAGAGAVGKAWLLLDETSGQVIASHAATARIEPASLTKIMTAYIVFGALQDGTLKPEQKVRVSTRAWKVPAGSSKMFLEPGSLVTVDNLLRGLMVQSGNDAAVALAEAVSGSVEAFVERMNQTAVALGLHGTHFASPHGLSDPATYSTVSDLSVLARASSAITPSCTGPTIRPSSSPTTTSPSPTAIACCGWIRAWTA